MNREDNTDYFLILEEKVESLIKYIHTLKKENNALSMKVESISRELEQLSKARDNAKDRMIALLKKIDQLNV